MFLNPLGVVENFLRIQNNKDVSKHYHSQTSGGGPRCGHVGDTGQIFPCCKMSRNRFFIYQPVGSKIGIFCSREAASAWVRAWWHCWKMPSAFDLYLIVFIN